MIDISEITDGYLVQNSDKTKPLLCYWAIKGKEPKSAIRDVQINDRIALFSGDDFGLGASSSEYYWNKTYINDTHTWAYIEIILFKIDKCVNNGYGNFEAVGIVIMILE